ncbi:MAG: hypothetical protein V3W14_03885 [Candidatus Neomarinimicrobiota bacterium]
MSAHISLRKNLGALTGDRRFKIRENIHAQPATLIEVDFDLMYENAQFRIYAEVAEREAGRVTDTAIDYLATAFRDSSRMGSIDPTMGIKALAEQIFGQPTDIDEDGLVYILLLDVRDDYDPTSSEGFVAGYFDPLDQGQGGNFADIIYLDTNPGNFAGAHSLVMLETLAHEYQHLIHFNRDTDEDSWMNEGLSELAPVLMGLPHREFSNYLTDTNVQLDVFNGDLADYARTGLFFLYSWVQLGTGFIQDLVQNRANGLVALQEELLYHSALGVDEFVNNWHVANMVAGQGEYGYEQLFSVPAPLMHNTIISFPNEDAGGSVARLGARWIMIAGGTGLYLKAGGVGLHDGLQMTLIKGDDHSILAAPFLTQTGFLDTTFGREYQVLYVLAAASSAVSNNASYSLYVTATGGMQEVVLLYDQGDTPESPEYLQLGDGTTAGEAAIDFTVTDAGGELANIQFQPVSSESLWVELYRETAFPVHPLYDSVITSPLAGILMTHWLPSGLRVARGETIYVLIGSRGNALAINQYQLAIRSYYRMPGQVDFHPLDYYMADGERLSGNWTIRLTYHQATAGIAIEDIPPGVGHFYPNPYFTTAASGPVSLPVFSPGRRVDLTVYDLLGRTIYRHPGRSTDEAAPLSWNGFMVNGRPAPSGVYFARLRIGDVRVVRKLLLLR